MKFIKYSYTKKILDGHLRGMTIPGNQVVYPESEKSDMDYHFEYMINNEVTCKDFLGHRFIITEFSIIEA